MPSERSPAGIEGRNFNTCLNVRGIFGTLQPVRVWPAFRRLRLVGHSELPMRPLHLGLVAVVCLSGVAALHAEEPAEDAKMKCVRRIEEPGKRFVSLAFSADGRRLA